MSLRVELLRAFAVRRGSVAVGVPHVGERLVAFLALHDRPVQRLYVAGSLWTDSSEEHAAASLRSTLWRLGRAAGELVATRGTTLGLADGVRVDLHEASACARRVIGCPAAREPADLELLNLAGDVLPDWYDDWVLLERERFRHMRLHALEALCATLTDEGRFAEATEAGLAALAAEPLRESAHRVLIAAHLAEGNPSEALRQYRLCRRLFREQLGIDPSPRLEALVAHLAHASAA